MTTKNVIDVLVVGARCAGAPLGLLLSRAGKRVVVIDADDMPSDQPMSTHFIGPYGMSVLQEIGIADKLRAFAPPISRMKNGIDDIVAEVEFNPLNRAVFRRIKTRTELGKRILAVHERRLSPFAAFTVKEVTLWTLGELLKGRFGVVKPFLAAGNNGAEVAKELERWRALAKDAAAAATTAKKAAGTMATATPIVGSPEARAES